MRYVDPDSGAVITSYSKRGDSFVQMYIALVEESKRKRTLLLDYLKENGYTLQHPNDGWVKRDSTSAPIEIFPSYPNLSSPPKVNTLACIGSYSDPKRTFACLIIGERANRLGSDLMHYTLMVSWEDTKELRAFLQTLT